MNKYIVNEKFEFEYGQDSVADVIRTGPSRYNIIHKNRSFEVEFEEKDVEMGLYEVKVNGKLFHVEHKSELTQLLEEMGMELGGGAQVKDVLAPMPGLVLDVMINEGDEVEEGENIIVLEAMKMENVIKSPGAGKIQSVLVKKGQNVDKNEVMLVFE